MDDHEDRNSLTLEVAVILKAVESQPDLAAYLAGLAFDAMVEIGGPWTLEYIHWFEGMNCPQFVAVVDTVVVALPVAVVAADTVAVAVPVVVLHLHCNCNYSLKMIVAVEEDLALIVHFPGRWRYQNS